MTDVDALPYQNRLEDTYASSPVASIVITKDEEVLFANEAAYHLLRIDEGSLSSVADLSVTDTVIDVGDLQQSIRRHLSSETPSTPWSGVLHLPTRQTIEVHFVPLPLDEPRCTLCYFLVQRVDDNETRARLLEEIRRERGRLRAVLEHMPTAIMLFDTTGKVLDLNRRARALVGRSSWQELGQDDHPFIVCDNQGKPLPRKEWPLFRALEQNIYCEDEEYVLDFGEHQRTISMSIVPIMADDGQITSFLVTGSDVTMRSEKDRRKDEFLSVASHELRSPLTPLSGFLHLSRKQAEAGDLVDPQILQRAQAQVVRLQRLIESLLDVSRLETGRLPMSLETISLTRLTRRVMEPWLVGSHGDRIVLTLPEESLEVRADPDRIDQVLTNVVDNAIKHGRADGTVKVRLDRRKDHAVLSVADEGDGMSQELIDRVFDRYFFGQDQTEEAKNKSLGLGLYIARQIVEGHDGTIAIDSDRGQPTQVIISLPILRE